MDCLWVTFKSQHGQPGNDNIDIGKQMSAYDDQDDILDIPGRSICQPCAGCYD